MIIGFFVVLGLAVYCFLSAVAGRWFYNGRKNRCKYCGPGGSWHNDRHCLNAHGVSAFFYGLAWPFAWIAACGVRVGDWISQSPERQKSKEDEATLAHERKMAEIKADQQRNESALRLLEFEGWKVRVTDA